MDDRRRTETATDHPARVMQREDALAATNLSNFLMDADHPALTELALGEARERVARITASGRWDPFSLPNLKLMDEMIDVVREQGATKLAQVSRVTDHRKKRISCSTPYPMARNPGPAACTTWNSP